MNKSEFVAAVAEEAKVSKADATKVLDAALKALGAGLKKDGVVRLAGLGTFAAKVRKAHNGVNPKTGKKIKIAAKKYVAFKAASVFKPVK